jgi:hypothetical protein
MTFMFWGIGALCWTVAIVLALRVTVVVVEDLETLLEKITRRNKHG